MEVMKIFLIVVICFTFCDFGQCFLPVIIGGISLGLGGVSYLTYCRFTECCTDNYIPADFTLLDKLLRENFYGQHLADETVRLAIRSHVNTQNRAKALAMSFHGSPGTGKNYLSDFIVKALYKEGVKSKYVHYFKGRLHFRSDALVERYQEELQKNITNHLKACPQSIFIFDEIEKIPKGTLDVIVPFIDYHPKIAGANATQAIFIFLSNTGASLIAEHLLEMWKVGRHRTEAKLQDFESMLAVSAFNENGGFYRSDTIDSSLIDHYVPFLPLEKYHVEKCAADAFRRRGVEPGPEQIEEAISHVTFGPAPYNIYSTAGCKRLDQKVGNIIQRDDDIYD